MPTLRTTMMIYALIVLGATTRAWLRIDAEAAATVIGLGVIFGWVVWRAWHYIAAILMIGRDQAPQRRR